MSLTLLFIGYQTFPGQALSRTDVSRTRRFPDNEVITVTRWTKTTSN